MNDTEFLSVAIWPRAAVNASDTPCAYWRPNQRVRILRAYMAATDAKPYTNVASYGTISILNGGTTAAGTTVVAHRHYGGATVDAITAGIPYSLDLNSTEEELEIDDRNRDMRRLHVRGRVCRLRSRLRRRHLARYAARRE
jgi:hypothetical protein